MTEEDINKRLHEILGLCWHTSTTDPVLMAGTWLYPCYKCNQKFFKNIDFTTSWEGFGLLWTWLQKHKLWWKFEMEHCNETSIIKLISPPTLSRTVVEFFEEAK